MFSGGQWVFGRSSQAGHLALPKRTSAKFLLSRLLFWDCKVCGAKNKVRHRKCQGCLREKGAEFV